MSNTAVTYVSSAKNSYETATIVFQDASANTYTATITLKDNPAIPPQSAPALSTAGTGGTVLAGTYNVVVSYTDANGETVGSPQVSQVTLGTTSTLTIASPPAANTQGAAATGWYAYVSSIAAPTVLTRQQTFGSPTAIGTGLTLTAPPTTTGAVPLLRPSDAPLTGLVRTLFI